MQCSCQTVLPESVIGGVAKDQDETTDEYANVANFSNKLHCELCPLTQRLYEAQEQQVRHAQHHQCNHLCNKQRCQSAMGWDMSIFQAVTQKDH